jgi:hypothetical protein
VKATESKAKVKRKAVRRPDFLISMFGKEWVGCWVALSHTKREHDAFSERTYYKATVFKKVCRRCMGFMVSPSPQSSPHVHTTSIGCRFHKRRAAIRALPLQHYERQNGLQKTYASPKCVIESGYDWNSIVIVW